jgi:hypothetical protein
MKSRINIWTPKTTGEQNNAPTRSTQEINRRKRNSQPNPEQIDDVQEEYSTSFEYVTIEQKPEPTFDDIKPEDGDYPPMNLEDRGILKSKQKRRHSLSVACSEEEAQLLRKAAKDKNMTFSNWARRTLFRSAGLSMPKRPR